MSTRNKAWVFCHFYRPQRSWGKVMFLRVCDSVHRGRGWYPSMHCRWYPSMPCSSSPGGYPSMPCRFPGPHPGGKLRGLAGGGSPGPHPRGKLRVWPGGFSRPTLGGGSSRPTPGGISRPTPGGSPGPHPGVCGRPTNGYCCGWYASYWNAFLLHLLQISVKNMQTLGQVKITVANLQRGSSGVPDFVEIFGKM